MDLVISRSGVSQGENSIEDMKEPKARLQRLMKGWDGQQDRGRELRDTNYYA